MLDQLISKIGAGHTVRLTDPTYITRVLVPALRAHGVEVDVWTQPDDPTTYLIHEKRGK